MQKQFILSLTSGWSVMDINEEYLINCKIKLQPILLDDKSPFINLDFFGDTKSFYLHEPTTLEYNDYLAVGQHQCIIEFVNKGLYDTQGDKDLAVSIVSVELNGFANEKIKWAGKYWPDYPAHYIEENEKNGKILESCLSYSTYLGWNGKWILEIESPIYTWLHKKLDFGTIYPNIC